MIVFTAENHTYTDSETNHILPSVTQILRNQDIAPSFKGVSKALLDEKAEVGTFKHHCIETFIKSGGKEVIPDEDVFFFIKHIYPNYDNWQSEVMVWTVGLVLNYAGHIDLIAEKNGRYIIIDRKTGQVHKYATIWQLTLYKFAWCRMNNIDPDLVDLAIWGPDGLEFVNTIPFTEVERLLECESKGIPYTSTLLAPEAIKAAEVFESTLTALKEQEEKANKEFKEAKEKIMSLMGEYGISSLTVGNVRLTRKKAYDSKSLNKVAVLEKYPDIEKDDAFWKVSHTKESLEIVRKDK